MNRAAATGDAVSMLARRRIIACSGARPGAALCACGAMQAMRLAQTTEGNTAGVGLSETIGTSGNGAVRGPRREPGGGGGGTDCCTSR